MRKFTFAVLAILLVLSLFIACDIGNNAKRRLPEFGDLALPTVDPDVTELVGTYEVLNDNSYLPKGRLYSFSDMGGGTIDSVPYVERYVQESPYEGSYSIEGSSITIDYAQSKTFAMTVENGNRVLKGGDITITLKKLSDDCIDVAMNNDPEISGFWTDPDEGIIYWFRDGICQTMYDNGEHYGGSSYYEIRGDFHNILSVPSPHPAIFHNYCFVGDSLVLGQRWLRRLYPV